jgi:hypothetical protein
MCHDLTGYLFTVIFRFEAIHHVIPPLELPNLPSISYPAINCHPISNFVLSCVESEIFQRCPNLKPDPECTALQTYSKNCQINHKAGNYYIIGNRDNLDSNSNTSPSNNNASNNNQLRNQRQQSQRSRIVNQSAPH